MYARRGTETIKDTSGHTHTRTHTHFLTADFLIPSRKAHFLCILSNVCYWALSRLQPVQRLPSTAINCRRVGAMYVMCTHTATNMHSTYTKNAKRKTNVHESKLYICAVFLVSALHPHPPLCLFSSSRGHKSGRALTAVHPPCTNTRHFSAS